jgi:long-chain acyl-CoA synthetase
MIVRTIPEEFRAAADQYRERLALVDGDQRITYGQLLEQVRGMRAWLQSALGPQPGDVIAVSLTNSPEFVACFFAVCELGAVLLLCNPQWRAAELRQFAGRLAIRGAVTMPHLRAEWDQLGSAIPPGSVLTVDQAPGHWESRGAPEPPCPIRGRKDAAVYITTSGSTGLPRIVPWIHGNLLTGARKISRALGIGPDSRLLSVVPFHHGYGFQNNMLTPLLHGASLVLMRQFHASACAGLIQRERVNVLLASPFLFGLLADSVPDPQLLSTLRICFAAGARLPEGLRERWNERFGAPLRTWYATTETQMLAFDQGREAPGEHAGSYAGAPADSVEVRFLGPDGQVLPAGAVGELAVRSDTLMPGYVGDPELNQRVFQDGFFRTGDLGYIDPAGNLYLTGRDRRVINIGGIKVDPVEIEQAMESLSGVAACHVDAAPNHRTGEVVRARIVLRHGASVSRRDVIEHCRQRLAEYKLPRIIEFVEASAAAAAVKVGGQWAGREPAET